MTERLYYTDSYLTRFEARVLDRSADGQRVYLDRTAFYPTSGGQPFDTGWLGPARVVDVVDEEDRIAHVLDRPLEAAEVQGEVDWERRFDHMQQHTGQHLLSAVFAERFGWATVSVHFGPDRSTLDLDTGGVTPDQAAEAERRANALVTENRPVAVRFEDAAEATGLRKATGRRGTLRIVAIENLDRSACGGTHLRATGEIGPILIRKLDRVKRQARVEFVCGARAVGRARQDFELLTRLGAMFTAAPEEVPRLVEGLKQELREAGTALTSAREEVARHRARELYHATLPDLQGLRWITCPGATLEELRATGQAVQALPRAVLLGNAESPFTILFAASEDSGVDAGTTLKAALAQAGGRGGGSPRLAQGTVADREALERVLQGVRSAVARPPETA